MTWGAFSKLADFAIHLGKIGKHLILGIKGASKGSKSNLNQHLLALFCASFYCEFSPYVSRKKFGWQSSCQRFKMMVKFPQQSLETTGFHANFFLLKIYLVTRKSAFNWPQEAADQFIFSSRFLMKISSVIVITDAKNAKQLIIGHDWRKWLSSFYEKNCYSRTFKLTLIPEQEESVNFAYHPRFFSLKLFFRF